MLCRYCRKKAYAKTRIGPLCEEHFERYIERLVDRICKRYCKINQEDNIIVAVSGGKDSAFTAYIMKNLGYNISLLLHIDLRIGEYSKAARKAVEELACEIDVPLKIIDVVQDFGIRIDSVEEKLRCSICGTVKRYLFNKIAFENAAVLATGHTLEDSCYYLFYGLISSDTESLLRFSPLLQENQEVKLAKKVKPIFLVSEREILAYNKLKGIPYTDIKCPYRDPKRDSKRNRLEKIFNLQEMYNFVSTFLKVKRKNKEVELRRCKRCGFPTTEEVCRFCRILEKYSVRKND